MTSGFEVIPEEIRRAGRAAAEAAEIAGGVRLAEALADVGPALPGSRTAPAAAALATAWREQLRRWRTDTDRHAAGLTAAADSYRQTDDRAAAHVGGAWPGGRRALR